MRVEKNMLFTPFTLGVVPRRSQTVFFGIILVSLYREPPVVTVIRSQGKERKNTKMKRKRKTFFKSFIMIV
jgi:hypothetical protein